MLIEFKVANYRSFREEQTLSLVASKDKHLKENCVDQGKLQLLKAVGIYGPNASGKSNLIRALNIMQAIVADSADYQPGRKLPLQPFLFDTESQKKPSTFEVTFFHEKIRYQYGFTATSERIYEEWLLAYPKGRAQTWYERTSNRDKWKFGSFLKGEREKLRDKTRDNVLFLSVGAQWNNKQLTTVYEWFTRMLRVMPAGTDWAPVTARMLLRVEDDQEERKLLYRAIESCLQTADLGIYGIKVREEEVTKPKFLAELAEGIGNALDAAWMDVKERLGIKVEMIHKDAKRSKRIPLSIQEESDGTKRFFELLGPWIQALRYGLTVFIDELETSLHPLLTRELIKYVQHPELSSKGAQLVFATHDTTLLDPELFRRDQIWFTEKDEHGGTRLYSMLDYKPRKGEAMQKGYLSGRYGAIPIVEAFEMYGQ